ATGSASGDRENTLLATPVNSGRGLSMPFSPRSSSRPSSAAAPGSETRPCSGAPGWNSVGGTCTK
ncbi:MAG: hypothetical protein ACK55I_11405, partial [bacterium]